MSSGPAPQQYPSREEVSSQGVDFSTARGVLSQVALDSGTLELLGQQIYLNLYPKSLDLSSSFYFGAPKLDRMHGPLLDLTALPESERALVLKGMTRALSDHLDGDYGLNIPVSPQLALELYMAGAEIEPRTLQIVFDCWITIDPGALGSEHQYSVLAYLRAYESYALDDASFDSFITKSLSSVGAGDLAETSYNWHRPIRILSFFDASKRIAALIEAKIAKNLITNQVQSLLDLDPIKDASIILTELDTVFKQFCYYQGLRFELSELVPALREFIGTELANRAFANYIKAATFLSYEQHEVSTISKGDQNIGLDLLATCINLAVNGCNVVQGRYLEVVAEHIADLKGLDLRVEPDTNFISPGQAKHYNYVTEIIVLKIIRALNQDRRINEEAMIEIVCAFIMQGYPCLIQNLAEPLWIDRTTLSQALLNQAFKVVSKEGDFSSPRNTVREQLLSEQILNLLYNGIELLNGARINSANEHKIIDLLSNITELLNLKLTHNTDKIISLVDTLSRYSQSRADTQRDKLHKIRERCNLAILKHGGYDQLKANGELNRSFDEIELGSYWEDLFKDGRYRVANLYLVTAIESNYSRPDLAHCINVAKSSKYMARGRSREPLIKALLEILPHLDNNSKYNKKKIQLISTDILRVIFPTQTSHSEEQRRADSKGVVQKLLENGFRGIAIELAYQIIKSSRYEPELSKDLLTIIQADTKRRSYGVAKEWSNLELESFRRLYLKVLDGMEKEFRKKLVADNKMSTTLDTQSLSNDLDIERFARSIISLYEFGRSIFSFIKTSDALTRVPSESDLIVTKLFSERALAWICSMIDSRGSLQVASDSDSANDVRGLILKYLLGRVLNQLEDLDKAFTDQAENKLGSNSLNKLFKSREAYRSQALSFALKLLEELNTAYQDKAVVGYTVGLFDLGCRIVRLLATDSKQVNKILENRFSIAIINDDFREAVRVKDVLKAITSDELYQLFKQALSCAEIEYACLFYLGFQSQDPINFISTNTTKHISRDQIQVIPNSEIEQIGELIAANTKHPERLILLELKLESAGYLNDRDPFRFPASLHAELLPSLVEEISSGDDYAYDYTKALCYLYFQRGDYQFKAVVQELLKDKFAAGFNVDLSPPSVARLAAMMDLQYEDIRISRYARECHAKYAGTRSYDLSILYRFNPRFGLINGSSKQNIFGDNHKLIWSEVVQVLCPLDNPEALRSSMLEMERVVPDGIYQFLQVINNLDKWLAGLKDQNIDETRRLENESILRALAQAATSTRSIVAKLNSSDLSRIKEIVVSHPEAVLRNLRLDWWHENSGDDLQEWRDLKDLFASSSLSRYEALASNICSSLQYLYSDPQ